MALAICLTASARASTRWALAIAALTSSGSSPWLESTPQAFPTSMLRRAINVLSLLSRPQPHDMARARAVRDGASARAAPAERDGEQPAQEAARGAGVPGVVPPAVDAGRVGEAETGGAAGPAPGERRAPVAERGRNVAAQQHRDPAPQPGLEPARGRAALGRRERVALGDPARPAWQEVDELEGGAEPGLRQREQGGEPPPARPARGEARLRRAQRCTVYCIKNLHKNWRKVELRRPVIVSLPGRTRARGDPVT